MMQNIQRLPTLLENKIYDDDLINASSTYFSYPWYLSFLLQNANDTLISLFLLGCAKIQTIQGFRIQRKTSQNLTNIQNVIFLQLYQSSKIVLFPNNMKLWQKLAMLNNIYWWMMIWTLWFKDQKSTDFSTRSTPAVSATR